MNEERTIYLCMGSACHQLRGYRLLPMLEELIHRHGLDGQLMVKGAFCLETCQQGRSLKFGCRVFAGLDENNLADFFEREILPHCQSH
jgi:NADH:ubiquinone oxidoreductase subunit E